MTKTAERQRGKQVQSATPTASLMQVLLPMVAIRSPGQFSVLRVMLALLAGGTLTLALSAAHHVIPSEHRGAGFAVL